MDPTIDLVPRLAALPGVTAVVLGGSRARGAHRPDSDWDLGLYYRGGFDAGLLRGLGHPGHVAQPGEWGRIVNGGAWLSVDGEPVDVLLRDLDRVLGWYADAQAGRFEIDGVEGHLAGLPTYVVVGELAHARVLAGSLPAVSYPAALRTAARDVWSWCAAFSLQYAGTYARRGELTACAGMLAKAALQAAHGIRAARGEWVLGEKGLLAAAGLAAADDVLAGVGTDAPAAVARMRDLLGAPRLDELGAHLRD